jgi:hypothetical protein
MQQFTPKAILAVWLVGLLLPATLSLQPHERHAAFIGYHEHPATGVQGKWMVAPHVSSSTKQEQHTQLTSDFMLCRCCCP